MSESDYNRITAALVHLQDARDLLHDAGATKAAAYVRRALKSAEGAERHARRGIGLGLLFTERATGGQ